MNIARLRRFIADKPYAVGPSAIGMRDNPYGAAVADNPDDRRQAMNRNDPRQRGLLGAAWNLGYFAHFAYGGAAAIARGRRHGTTRMAASIPPITSCAASPASPVALVTGSRSRRRGRCRRWPPATATGDRCGLPISPPSRSA